MGTIEQASKRLEQLSRAGVEVPWSGETAPRAADQPAALAGSLQNLPSAPLPLGEPRQRVDINLAALADAGYLVPGAPRSKLMDELRGIKRPLLANAFGKRERSATDRGSLVMVTSSLPGEGKSFLSLNLAISLAMEPDQRVLLVDADPTRRVASERLGVADGRRGFIDLLLDSELPFSEVELATNVERLSLLPAGTSHELATELFASREAGALFDRMAGDASKRLVIFDAPPLLFAAEARALAPQLGQVLVVVQAGRTQRGTVEHALALVEDCPLVMTVLNQAQTPAPSSPYGYYAY